MIKEFKSSQLIELKKLSKTIYDMAESALAYRAKLFEHVGTTQYEIQKYESLRDPESFYHFKLFDKAVSIIRLYSNRDWLNEDEEKNKFHFAICCYNFKPSISLKYREYQDHIVYGDFETIDECIKYFISAIIQISDTEYDILLPVFKNEVEI